jgi:glycosyltransferase involved in cell wall biosynthesis
MEGATEPQNIAEPPAGSVRLSVITPVLNAERYIEGCIRNVIDQNVAGIEHIIMDGMSTDQTLVITRRLAAENPSIRIFSENDGSQAAAMNHGIALARAPVIGFLNADDYYEPGVLNRVLDIFKGLPDPSLIVGNCNVRDVEDKIIVVNRPARLTLLDLVQGREYPWNPAAYFYHKSLHDLVGAYDPKEHYVMDLDFLMRAVRRAHVLYFDEIWGNFRWMEGTKTFSDAKTGQMEKRCNALRDKYSVHLSLPEKFRLWTYRTSRKLFRPAYLWIKQRLSSRGNGNRGT